MDHALSTERRNSSTRPRALTAAARGRKTFGELVIPRSSSKIGLWLVTSFAFRALRKEKWQPTQMLFVPGSPKGWGALSENRPPGSLWWDGLKHSQRSRQYVLGTKKQQTLCKKKHCICISSSWVQETLVQVRTVELKEKAPSSRTSGRTHASDWRERDVNKPTTVETEVKKMNFMES